VRITDSAIRGGIAKWRRLGKCALALTALCFAALEVPVAANASPTTTTTTPTTTTTLGGPSPVVVGNVYGPSTTQGGASPDISGTNCQFIVDASTGNYYTWGISLTACTVLVNINADAWIYSSPHGLEGSATGIKNNTVTYQVTAKKNCGSSSACKADNPWYSIAFADIYYAGGWSSAGGGCYLSGYYDAICQGQSPNFNWS
jgi:hypothetical protein